MDEDNIFGFPSSKQAFTFTKISKKEVRTSQNNKFEAPENQLSVREKYILWLKN